MKKEKYRIEKIFRKEKDKEPYSFENLLDTDSIKKAVKEAKNKKIPDFILSKIEIHPSGTCNLSCKICIGRKIAPKRRVNLSYKKIKMIFEDIRKNMLHENPLIILSGLYSEPLRNPKIKQIIDLLGEYKLRFGIYTNGLLMNDRIMQAIIKSASGIKSSKPSYVSFNVSASINSNQFTNILEIIKKLNKKRKNKNKLKINAPIIVTKEDYNSLKFYIKHLISAGVDTIRLSTPLPQHRFDRKRNEIEEKEYKRLIKIFEKLKKEYPDKIRIRYKKRYPLTKHCFVMAQTIAISPEGDIFPCPEVCTPFFRKKFSYGSIKKNSVSKLWGSKQHENLFYRLNPKKEKCECCPVDSRFNSICESFHVD